MRLDARTKASRVEDLLKRFRDAGMNVTPQRVTIYQALLESEDHPSPEVLYQRVLPRLPNLSLATIYKALDALTRVGVVREVSVISDSKRFDANLDHHHHLICERCQRVTDFYDPELDKLPAPKRVAGFVTESMSVQIMGTCADCAKKKR